jgi:hypothetical protein
MAVPKSQRFRHALERAPGAAPAPASPDVETVHGAPVLRGLFGGSARMRWPKSNSGGFQWSEAPDEPHFSQPRSGGRISALPPNDPVRNRSADLRIGITAALTRRRRRVGDRRSGDSAEMRRRAVRGDARPTRLPLGDTPSVAPEATVVVVEDLLPPEGRCYSRAHVLSTGSGCSCGLRPERVCHSPSC